MKYRQMFLFVALLGIGVILVALTLSLGSVSIPFSALLQSLLGSERVSEEWRVIVMELRFPRALTAFFAGGALSVSGLGMQTLFQNPLAGPFILGINGGASLGVAMATLIVGSLANVGLAGAAWLGSCLIMMAMLAVAGKIKDNTTLLILGLMFGYAVSALVSVLIHFSTPERIQQFVAWSFGSFSSVSWEQLSLLVPASILGSGAAFIMAKPLNALLLGESYASTMGVPVKRVRILLIALTSFLAGSVTAFCGPIAFLGVAVPHLCRGAFKSADHRFLVPACALVGGNLALCADFIAHVPGSSIVLPLNAVTSLIGAPVVVWVVFRSRRKEEM